MKALSLTQPCASAIILGHKRIETRSWKTNYRGRIAIHASKGFPKYARAFDATERALGRIPNILPFGAIIGFATIEDIKPAGEIEIEISAIERLYGDYSPGRWAWILSEIEPLPDDKVLPCKGSLGLWGVPETTGFSGQ
jgi:hypothetical protein